MDLDVIILGRGGGSIEDLWAFNDEQVAKAIYDSRIPVISAVGHEPDVTIADYVADVRAATPSNAAELAVPDCDSLRQNLDGIQSAIAVSMKRRVISAKQQLDALSASPALLSPTRYIEQKRKNLELLSAHLSSSHTRTVSLKKQQYIALTAKLDAMSPLKVLTRGYAMVQAADHGVIRSVKQVTRDEKVTVTLGDGFLTANVTDIKETSL